MGSEERVSRCASKYIRTILSRIYNVDGELRAYVRTFARHGENCLDTTLVYVDPVPGGCERQMRTLGPCIVGLRLVSYF